jgi:membrane protein involved in colicin uptake
VWGGGKSFKEKLLVDPAEKKRQDEEAARKRAAEEEAARKKAADEAAARQAEEDAKRKVGVVATGNDFSSCVAAVWA